MGALHWIAHRLGWNAGRVETRMYRGRLVVGFRCSGCGAVQGVHAVNPDRLLETFAAETGESPTP